MQSRVYSIQPHRDVRWNQFVQNHPFGWVCHLSEWKNILEESFPNIKGYYYVCLDDEEKNIRSALPLFLVKSRILKKRIVSIPFASVCDIIVSTKEDYHALIKCSNSDLI